MKQTNKMFQEIEIKPHDPRGDPAETADVHLLRPIGLGGSDIKEAWLQAFSGIKGRMPPQPFVYRVKPFSGTLGASEAFLSIKGKEGRQSARALPQSFCPQPHRGGHHPAYHISLSDRHPKFLYVYIIIAALCSNRERFEHKSDYAK